MAHTYQHALNQKIDLANERERKKFEAAGVNPKTMGETEAGGLLDAYDARKKQMGGIAAGQKKKR